jgi:AraC-like DNA-binding protein
MDSNIFDWLVRNELIEKNLNGAIYDGDQKISDINIAEPFVDLASIYRNVLYAEPEGLFMHGTSSMLLFGIIKDLSSSRYVLIGPAKQIKNVSDPSIRDYMIKHNIDLGKIENVAAVIKAAPVITNSEFYSLLSRIFVIINRQFPRSENYLDFFDYPALNQVDVSKDVYQNTVQINETEDKLSGSDFSKYYEDQLVLFIQTGRPEAFNTIVPREFHSRTMMYGIEKLREYKDRCVSFIAIGVRAAIDGGLDTDTGYKLNDLYIHKIEMATNEEEMNVIIQSVISDLCTRVGNIHIKKTDNPTLNRAISYINEHLREKLSTSIVGKAIHVSPSYLTVKFKDAVGMKMMEYIDSQKIEEGKRLLKYTDKSLSDISNYLAFSSQSHFQNMFRRLVGMTPGDYRKRNSESAVKDS